MEEAEDIHVEAQENTSGEEVQARVDEEVPLQDVRESQPERASKPPHKIIPRRSRRVVRQPERRLGLQFGF